MGNEAVGDVNAKHRRNHEHGDHGIGPTYRIRIGYAAVLTNSRPVLRVWSVITAKTDSTAGISKR